MKTDHRNADDVSHVRHDQDGLGPKSGAVLSGATCDGSEAALRETDSLRALVVYGPLRDLLPEGCSLRLRASATPDDVRAALVEFRRGLGFDVSALERLLARSVIACNDTVLLEHEPIGEADTLAILPPVCGG